MFVTLKHFNVPVKILCMFWIWSTKWDKMEAINWIHDKVTAGDGQHFLYPIINMLTNQSCRSYQRRGQRLRLPQWPGPAEWGGRRSSPALLGGFGDAVGERGQAGEQGVPLVLLRLPEPGVGAVQPVQNAEHAEALVEPGTRRGTDQLLGRGPNTARRRP